MFLQKLLVHTLLCIILTAVSLSAEDTETIAVFRPSSGDIEMEESVRDDIFRSLLEALSFEPRLKPAAVYVSPDPGQTDALIDVIRGTGDAGLKEDYLPLIRESTLVVVPEIIFLNVSAEEDKAPTCRVDLLLRILEAGSRRVMETLSVEVEAGGETEEAALRFALEQIRQKAEGEFKTLPFFTEGSYIIEILSEGRLVLDLSRTDGVVPGDEFRIVSRYGGGSSQGILIIDDMTDTVSYGYIFYADEGVTGRTKIEKMERPGIEVSAYGRSMISVSQGIEGTDEMPFSAVFGIRGYPGRWFPHIRPFLGLETPMHGNLGEWPGVPVNCVTGLEARWNIGRLQIAPSSTLGVGLLLPAEEGDVFMASHFGSTLEVVFNVLVHPDIRIFSTAGYAWWTSISRIALSSSGADSYGGILLGLGGRIKL